MNERVQAVVDVGDSGVTISMPEKSPRGFLRMLLPDRSGPAKIDDWVSENAALCDAVAALRRFGEEEDCVVTIEDQRISADHRAIAKLSQHQATALGLPPLPTYVFEVGTTGSIGKDSFRLVCSWLNGDIPVMVKHQGAILETSDGKFRIPDPIFSALTLAEEFHAQEVDVTEHWSALARFRQLLDPDNAPSPEQNPTGRDIVRMASSLQRMKIYTASSFSLALRDGPDGVNFDPVLFSRDAVETAMEGNGEISETDGLLPEDLLHRFQGEGSTAFVSFDQAKPTYLLGEGQYLLLGPDLEAALRVVREKQKASPREREVFAANPRAALREAIGRASEPETADDLVVEEEADDRLAAVFQETLEFADRAIGIGIWEKPKFDFLPKSSNDWLPEVFPLVIDGKHFFVKPDDVEPLRTQIKTAIEENRETVDHHGDPLPATEAALEQLDQVRARIEIATRPDAEVPKPQPDTDDPTEAGRPLVIKVHENFVSNSWEPSRVDRRDGGDWSMPEQLLSEPLPHQEKGIAALIEAWRSPLPGFLQADDQGLGKTFQTLAFLAWLRNQQTLDRDASPMSGLPILIVAPTSLLRTWEQEARTHLRPGALGELFPVYGNHLKSLRTGAGKELDDGRPRLDLSRLQSSGAGSGERGWWVLTTYETLANYQHSFHAIPFAVVVFDEIQKIKNPATINAQAAKSVQADFRIGLTGTPIENHVADLWAIMDAITPGRLVSMKDFARHYGVVTEDSMKDLHARLFEPQEHNGSSFPPLAIRRMKEGSLEGLMRKDFRIYPVDMPTEQMEAYDSVREKLRDGAKGSALKLLHHIRSVSLHHQSGRGFNGSPDDFISGSARLATLFELLDHIEALGERALVFIEDRDMQYRIAELIRSRFGLAQVRIINGQTTIPRRQAHVEAFQHHLAQDRGFDVMVLGPKAAGVGLTLTAATHVIHLSRWWNPAVEEQCNDRIYRIGQKRDVTIHLPMAVHPGHKEKSFDCILNELMKRKRLLARAALWPPTDQDSDVEVLMSGLSGSSPLDLTEIDGFDWQRFEQWVLDQCAKTGEWDCFETRASGDGGADVVLKHRQRPDSWSIIQVKHSGRTDRKLGRSAVEDTLRARASWNKPNPQLAVVTNIREFDEEAMKLARAENVRLVSRGHLSLWPRHILA
ncbi:MAG: SNF2-related protein [Minwuia sp.]|nr:SNF2-related protein [Minwuia sp.]